MCDARSGNSLQLDFGEGSFARSMQQNSCVLLLLLFMLNQIVNHPELSLDLRI